MPSVAADACPSQVRRGGGDVVVVLGVPRLRLLLLLACHDASFCPSLRAMDFL